MLPSYHDEYKSSSIPDKAQRTFLNPRYYLQHSQQPKLVCTLAYDAGPFSEVFRPYYYAPEKNKNRNKGMKCLVCL